MAPRWLQHSICCWVMSTLFICIFLLVWYLWEPPDISQAVTTNTTDANQPRTRTKRQTKDSECGTDVQTKNTALVFCSPKNQTSAIIIPYSALTNAVGQKGDSWGPEYEWYVTIGSGWGALIGETGYNWTTWSIETTVDIRRDFSVSKNTQGLVLQYKTAQDECLTVSLWAYSSGKDPEFATALCYKNRSLPNMPTRTRQRGGRIVILAKRVGAVDDWFQATTGVSGQSNNWLLMVEQAANVTKTDCVVCMGPRPLLQIIPAAIEKTCIVNVMNKTNPTSECQKWDEVFPNTQAEKKKPIFSKYIASGNFSCINLTGKGERLGNLSTTRCTYMIQVDDTFKPVPRSDIWWWCGDDRLFDKLARNMTGYCALVTLLLIITCPFIQYPPQI